MIEQSSLPAHLSQSQRLGLLEIHFLQDAGRLSLHCLHNSSIALKMVLRPQEQIV